MRNSNGALSDFGSAEDQKQYEPWNAPIDYQYKPDLSRIPETE